MSTNIIVNDLWRKTSEMGAEVETGQMIYSLIRLMKPERCIETGCALGDTTYQMGLALRENGKGRLFTCDIDEERVKAVRDRCQDLPVNVYQMPGIEMLETMGDIDFAFIDSGWSDIRVAEVKSIAPRMRENGLVVLHDVCQNYHMAYQEALRQFGKHGLVIDTPFGVGIFQKGDPQFTHIGKLVDEKRI